MKKFTSVHDIDNVDTLVNQALKMKANPLAQLLLGANKTLCLLFFNPSLRTRLSTQKAAYNLGMNVMVMNLSSDGWQIEMEDGTVMNEGSQEHIKEAAAVVSQYCDILGLRTFPSLTDKESDYADAVLNKFLTHVSVPIISLESAVLHPLQSLADAITIAEQNTKPRSKVVLSWAPHPKALPQAVANSFVQWMRETDVDLVITNPPNFDLSKNYIGDCKIIHNQEEAFADADFIYAKNWSSFDDYGKIGIDLNHWMIDKAKMDLTNNAKFMHCLPVRRNVVVSDEVMDSEASLVIQQANNRTYSAQVVLSQILENGR